MSNPLKADRSSSAGSAVKEYHAGGIYSVCHCEELMMQLAATSPNLAGFTD